MRERAKKGEFFFYITNFKGKFNLSKAPETGDMFCKNCFNEGNYFLTEIEGEKALKVIKKETLKFHYKTKFRKEIKKC